MKLIETRSAPNARRVRMFLAEKNIEMEYEQIDLEKGENLSEDYRKKNPMTKIPVLELDDGTHLSESMAICRYFEELQPEPALMGRTPMEKAQIEMWQRRMEWHFLVPVGMAFQHITGFFSDRMTPVAEWGKLSAKEVTEFMGYLDRHLANSTYIAGEDFSVADITALCSLDFARVIKIRPSEEEHGNLIRWRDLMYTRESAKA